MTIADDLRRELVSPPRATTNGGAPKGFEPGVRYVEGRPAEITTGAVTEILETQADYQRVVESMGITLPAGYVLRLVEAKYDPAAWHRDEAFIDDEAEEGRRTKAPAVTRPVWRYRFVPEIALGTESDLDLAELHKQAKRAHRAKAGLKVDRGDSTMVVCLGDVQAGKVDFRGGTVDLLERLEGSLADVIKQVRKVKPMQIVLLDNGDAMEMFESAPGADRTNDLQLTEQIRVWRRLLWRWVDALSKLTDDLVVASVPSNHCSVRRGKMNMGTPADDYGIEVLAQVSDIAAGNPEAYGHVSFVTPPEYDESIAIQLVGGKILGAAHGHQKTRPEAIGAWMAGQALGRSPVGHADILFIGHWHNLRVQTVGDDRWVFIVPTSDSGSSWYRNLSGDESAAGVLTVVIDAVGWRDLHVCWQRG